MYVSMNNTDPQSPQFIIPLPQEMIPQATPASPDLNLSCDAASYDVLPNAPVDRERKATWRQESAGRVIHARDKTPQIDDVLKDVTYPPYPWTMTGPMYMIELLNQCDICGETIPLESMATVCNVPHCRHLRMPDLIYLACPAHADMLPKIQDAGYRSLGNHYVTMAHDDNAFELQVKYDHKGKEPNDFDEYLQYTPCTVCGLNYSEEFLIEVVVKQDGSFFSWRHQHCPPEPLPLKAAPLVFNQLFNEIQTVLSIIVPPSSPAGTVFAAPTSAPIDGFNQIGLWKAAYNMQLVHPVTGLTYPVGSLANKFQWSGVAWIDRNPSSNTLPTTTFQQIGGLVINPIMSKTLSISETWNFPSGIIITPSALNSDLAVDECFQDASYIVGDITTPTTNLWGQIDGGLSSPVFKFQTIIGQALGFRSSSSMTIGCVLSIQPYTKQYTYFVGQNVPNDVHIVEIDPQDSPLWISSFDPVLPSIIPPAFRRKVDADRNNKKAHTINGNTTRAEMLASIERQKQMAFAQAASLLPTRQPVTQPKTELSAASPAFVPASVEGPKNTGHPDLLRMMLVARIETAKVYAYEGRLLVHVLPPLDIEAEIPIFEDKEEQPNKPERRTSNRASEGSGRSKGGKPPGPVETEEDYLKRCMNYNNGIVRVAEKLSKNTHTVLDWYETHPEAKEYRLSVLDKVYGANWTQKADLSSTQWVLYCKLKGVSSELMILQLLEIFPEWRSSVAQGSVAPTWTKYVSKDWIETCHVLEAERAAHNKKVHADNGNTSICRIMDEVDARPTSDSMYQDSPSPSSPSLKGSHLALRLATQPASTNPTQINNALNSVIRGDTIAANNTITANVCLPLPCTQLIPREVRPLAGGPVINSTIRLPTKVVIPVPFVTQPLVDTELTAIIVQALVHQNQNMGRADNTNINGFNAIDLGYLCKQKAYYGLSMDTCMLKLSLLHNILSWGAPATTLPFNEVSAIDQSTQANPALPAIVTVNTSPIFGEACGGNTSLFPYTNDAGRIAFHLTLQSVPVDRKNAAIFCPTAFLMLDGPQFVGEVLALFVLMWSRYPVNMYNVSIPTVDVNGANPANQRFCPLSSIVNIPGKTIIDIILPRNTTARNPTSQQEALDLSVLVPIAGPIASNNIPANAALNPSFIGAGGLQEYDLAEYIYTWASSFDLTTIANFMSRLSLFTGISNALERVKDISSFVSTCWPAMETNTAAANSVFAPNSAAQGKYSNCQSIRFPLTQADWPQTTTGRADIMVNMTDEMAWNKVVTGLATAEPVLEAFILPEWVGNVNSAYWESLRSMAFAVTYTSHYANMGWPSSVWNTAFTNNTMNSYRDIVRQFYAIATSDHSTQKCTRQGPYLASYHHALWKTRLGITPGGATIFDSICPPTTTYCNVILPNGADQDIYTPGCLVDIWMQLMAEGLPRWQSSFPLPNGLKSLMGYSKGLKALVVPGNVVIGGFIDPQYYMQTINANETADFSEDVRWNERLGYLAGQGVMTYINGAGVVGAPAVNTFPKQRFAAAIAYLPPRVAGIQASNTMMFPNTDNAGQLIYSIGPAVNMLLIRQAEVRTSQLSVAGWQLGNAVAWNANIAQTEVATHSKWSRAPQRQEGKEAPKKVDSPVTEAAATGDTGLQ